MIWHPRFPAGREEDRHRAEADDRRSRCREGSPRRIFSGRGLRRHARSRLRIRASPRWDGPSRSCAIPTATARSWARSICIFSRRESIWQLYEKFGAHLRTIGGDAGVYFAVWAPNAQRVSVVGDFNGWDGRVNPMRKLLGSGVWELFLPGVEGRRALQVRDHDAAPAPSC